MSSVFFTVFSFFAVFFSALFFSLFAFLFSVPSQMDALYSFNAFVFRSGISRSNADLLIGMATNAMDMAYAQLVELSCMEPTLSHYEYACEIFDVQGDIPMSIIKNKQNTFLDILQIFTQNLRNDYLSLLPPLVNIYTPKDALQISIKNRLDKIAFSIFTMGQILYYTARARHMHIPTEVAPPFEGIYMTMETFDDAKNEKALTDQHKLMLFALHELSMMCARRFDDWIMVPKYTNTGHYNTTSYTRYMPISDFLPNYVNRTKHPVMWNILTQHKNAGEWTAKFLLSHKNPEFPELERCRTRFAFNNGIYDARYDKFTRYTKYDRQTEDKLTDAEREELESLQRAEEDMFQALIEQTDFSRGQDNESAASRLHEQSLHIHDADGPVGKDAACVYFDTQFMFMGDATEDFMEIPTPYLDKIFKAQDFHKSGKGKNNMPYDGDDVMAWTYAMIGRMLYDVNSVDQWQIAPFYKGYAGTGKSTILKIMKMLYETEDIGIMSNNIEGTFGLAGLYTKLIIICYEIRSDFGLDQAVLQSIISGEDMSIPIKFKTALPIITWTTPIAVAGNETANWNGAQGAMSRRWVFFEFKTPVKESDPMLMRNIEGEKAAIIAKCNRAYLTMVRKHGSQNVWAKNAKGEAKALPQIFHDHADALNASLNSLIAYLKTGLVIFHDDMKNLEECAPRENYYMSWTSFLTAYSDYCKNIAKCTPIKLVNPDSYEQIFKQFGLEKIKDTKKSKANPNQSILTEWVIGCLPFDAKEARTTL